MILQIAFWAFVGLPIAWAVWRTLSFLVFLHCLEREIKTIGDEVEQGLWDDKLREIIAREARS